MSAHTSGRLVWLRLCFGLFLLFQHYPATSRAARTLHGRELTSDAAHHAAASEEVRAQPGPTSILSRPLERVLAVATAKVYSWTAPLYTELVADASAAIGSTSEGVVAGKVESSEKGQQRLDEIETAWQFNLKIPLQEMPSGTGGRISPAGLPWQLRKFSLLFPDLHLAMDISKTKHADVVAERVWAIGAAAVGKQSGGAGGSEPAVRGERGTLRLRTRLEEVPVFGTSDTGESGQLSGSYFQGGELWDAQPGPAELLLQLEDGDPAMYSEIVQRNLSSGGALPVHGRLSRAARVASDAAFLHWVKGVWNRLAGSPQPRSMVGRPDAGATSQRAWDSLELIHRVEPEGGRNGLSLEARVAEVPQYMSQSQLEGYLRDHLELLGYPRGMPLLARSHRFLVREAWTLRLRGAQVPATAYYVHGSQLEAQTGRNALHATLSFRLPCSAAESAGSQTNSPAAAPQEPLALLCRELQAGM